jgi:hypothetical protein
MLRKQLAALAVVIACMLSPAEAQTYKDASGTVVPGVVPLVGCSTGGNCTAPVSNTNPLPISGSFSAAGFTPNGNSANIGSVTTASSYVALPTGAVVVVYNSGSAAITTKLGTTSGVTVTATTGDVIQPGSWISYTVGSNTYLAAITASGSSSLVITAGTGQPSGSGGGSSSSGGGAITAGSGAYATGSLTAGAGVDGWNLTEGAKGDSAYAGSGSASIVGVLKGIYSAALTGTGATAAAYPTSAIQFGCAYNTSLPSATTGNLYAAQCDSSARLYVNVGTSALPTGAATSANQTNVQSAPGTPQTVALTVQGNSSGVAVPVSGAASTFVDGWNVTEGTKADSAYTGSGSASIVGALKGIYSAALIGTGATGAAYPPSAVLFGCAYNTTLPTATSGNLYSEQCDASARQIVVGAGVAGTPAGGVLSVQGVASGTPVIINETQIGGNALNTGTGASGTGTQRVAVSTDSPGGATANPAYDVPQAATSGGATVAIQSALTTPVVVKASAGQVYKVQCDNLAGAGSAWVELINAASSPALGTNVIDQVAIAAGSTGGFSLPIGEAFSTGISIGAATASNGSTAVSTAVNCSVSSK